MTQPRSTLVSLNATPWHHSGTATSRRPLRVVASLGQPLSSKTRPAPCGTRQPVSPIRRRLAASHRSPDCASRGTGLRHGAATLQDIHFP